MKRYINLLSLVILFSSMLLISCEKEAMTYEGKDTIYFDIRRGAEWTDKKLWAHEHYSTVSFGNTTSDIIELDLPVCVSGKPSDIDRSFSIVVVDDSTTVQQDDYTGIESIYTIKAGETKTNVHLSFSRKSHMKNDTLQLQLALVENEHFSLMYKDFGPAPEQYEPTANSAFDYNHDATVHNIFVYDVIVRPARWIGNDENGLGLWGRFSVKKWQLIMELTDTTVEDYNSTETMPDNRRTSIATFCGKYVAEKAKAGTPILDEDGTMMYFMAAAYVNWQPFTNPSDYYGHDNWTEYQE